MVKGFYNRKDLICCIIAVLLLLSICMTVDYADEINNQNESSYNKTLVKGAIVTNNSSIMYVKSSANVIVPKTSDRIHYEHSIIGMYAKPSCGCRYSYRWHYREFINYCPNCHHYGTLRKNPKGVPEREYTCHRCSSDFCGVCGKEKYSWSRVYLRK